MFEHRCGRLSCPACLEDQTFVALVVEGKHFNFQGLPVTHITDASCRVCGFTYGRQDVRDEATGAVAARRPIIDNATALRAARAIGLPPHAALFGETEGALAAEARAAAVAIASLMAPATPAAGPCSLRSPAPAAGPVSDSLRSSAPGPGAPQDSLRSPVSPPAEFDPDDQLAAFLEQHRAGSAPG
jgi:hypothetical protein